MLRDARVLVTGGAGFIGSNLVRRLSALGSVVTILDDFSNGLKSNLADLPAAKIVEGSITEQATVQRAVRECRFVFHQAALGSVPRSMRDPVRTHEVNVLGTAIVLTEAASAGVRRVVYASSGSVYGDDPMELKREGAEGSPLSPYGASKAAAELIARAHARAFGLDVIGLRYFNVYGPFQRPDAAYAAVVPLFTAALHEGRSPAIFGDGLQVRDFTFVDDVVEANILAATVPGRFAGEALNISSGLGCSVVELFEELRCACGRGDIKPTHQPERPGDIRTSRADTSLARSRIGFMPHTPLATGLSAYLAWFRRSREAVPQAGPSGTPSQPA